MNLETYLREKRAKGYYAFNLVVVRLNSKDVRIDIAPMVADRCLTEEAAQLVVKEDTITMDGEVHDHVRRLLKESKEELDMAKINNDVNNYQEHYADYNSRIIVRAFKALTENGDDGLAEYLKKNHIQLFPGGEFKFDL